MKTITPILVLSAVLFACGGSDPAPATPAAAPAAANGGDATASKPTSDTPVPNIEKAVSDLRPDFRTCYNTALAKDPKIQGSMTVVAKVDAKGAVTSATAGDGPSLPTDVVQCITTRIQQAKFDAPGGTGSTIQIPITFKQQ
jgi:hypothetical protein